MNCTYHLVSEDAVDTRLVEANKPVQTIKLIVSELAANENRWLLVKPGEGDHAILVIVLLGAFSVVEIGAGLLLALIGAQDGVTVAERAHLGNGVCLHLHQLFGLSAAGLQTTSLHEDELGEKLRLL